MNDAPKIASPDDIDAHFANRAFSGTSFSPEKRGHAAREDYANAVNGFYAELWPSAETDEQKSLLATEMERYRQGYLAMERAYLASHSNLVSTMIAGPSNFPVARQRKRSDWTDKKGLALIEWNRRARAAVFRKLWDARPLEAKLEHAWQMLRRDLCSSLATIRAIDLEGSPYTRSAFVNSIAGKVERLAAAGDVDMVGRALQLVTEYNGANKKPAISARHKFWSMAQLAEESRARRATRERQEPAVISARAGVEISRDPGIDRVRIVFDSKPDARTLAALKGAGWNWSHNAGAWQRKLTPAAEQSALAITGLIERAAEPVAAAH